MRNTGKPTGRKRDYGPKSSNLSDTQAIEYVRIELHNCLENPELSSSVK